jgi:hypothetical protein
MSAQNASQPPLRWQYRGRRKMTPKLPQLRHPFFHYTPLSTKNLVAFPANSQPVTTFFTTNLEKITGR